MLPIESKLFDHGTLAIVHEEVAALLARRGLSLAEQQQRIDSWRDGLPAKLRRALETASVQMVVVLDGLEPDRGGDSFGPRAHFDGPERKISIRATDWEWADLLSGQLRDRSISRPWLVPPIFVALGQAVHLAQSRGHWDHPSADAHPRGLVDESVAVGWHVGRALLGGVPTEREDEPYQRWYDWVGDGAVLKDWDRTIHPGPPPDTPRERGRALLHRRAGGGPEMVDRALCPDAVRPHPLRRNPVPPQVQGQARAARPAAQQAPDVEPDQQALRGGLFRRLSRRFHKAWSQGANRR
jgi:hypothetical protein